jgi:hypothetical protein
MQADPQGVADTVAWLRRVAGELRAAEVDPDGRALANGRSEQRRVQGDLRAAGAKVDVASQPPLLGDGAFHCQQAAQKALNTFVTWRETPFGRTYDLAELGRQWTGIDGALEPVCRRWGQSLQEVEEVLFIARAVHSAVRARLLREVGP